MDTPDASQNRELNVYILQRNFSDIAEAVTQFRSENEEISCNITQFDTVKELDDSLVRDLNTNTAPDVVLLDYATTLDLHEKEDIPETLSVLASQGMNGKTLFEDEDSLKKAVDWIKLLKQQNAKFQSSDGEFWDCHDALRWDDNLFYTVSGYDLATSAYFYAATLKDIYPEGADYVIFPTQSSPQTYSVLGTFFGAVSKDCDQPEDAFRFLSLVADSYYNIRVTQDNPMWFSPVRYENLDKALKVYTTYGGQIGGTQIDLLSQTGAQRIRDFYGAIGSYCLPDPSLVKFIDSKFAGYFSDTEAYDSAFTKFQRKYKLYLDE